MLVVSVGWLLHCLGTDRKDLFIFVVVVHATFFSFVTLNQMFNIKW